MELVFTVVYAYHYGRNKRLHWQTVRYNSRLMQNGCIEHRDETVEKH